MLTNTEIEAIRKRAEKATEEPWQLEDTADGAYITDGEHWIICGHCERLTDAQFIAHAREDIPKLLAEIDRLRDEISFVLNVDMTKNAYDVEHVAVSVKSWAHRALYGEVTAND